MTRHTYADSDSSAVACAVNQQLATAMTILGAMIGGLFAAYPNDHLGR